MWMGWMSAQGRTAHKKRTKIQATKGNMFKIECCGSYGRLPTEKKRKKNIVDSQAASEARSACEVVANEVYTVQLNENFTYES